jgi:hypothetical protein
VRQHRILVLGSSHGGGDWPPLAAVAAGLQARGHTVCCFGDAVIAKDCASMAIPTEVCEAADSLGARMARWRAAGAFSPPPFGEWADSCFPALSAVIRSFKPELLLSQLFTIVLARNAKEASGVQWCCINPAYYFGRDSMRPLEADFAGPALTLFPCFMDALAGADMVLHGTDPLFDPPPPTAQRGSGMARDSRSTVGVGDRKFPASARGDEPRTDCAAEPGGVTRPRRSDPECPTPARAAGNRPRQCADRALRAAFRRPKT